MSVGRVMLGPVRAASMFAAAAALSGCDEPSGIQNVGETWQERAARHQVDFEKTPDVQLPEVRKRLTAMGMPASAIKMHRDDNEVDVLALRPSASVYAGLDKPALAKLLLDSRYRFDFVDPGQIRDFAQHVGVETERRETAKARREIIERGEAERIPIYRPGMSMTLYAVRLERYCGYGPEEALQVTDGRWLNYRPTMVAMAVMGDTTVGAEKFDCMKRAVDALELRRFFIGNRGTQGARPS